MLWGAGAAQSLPLLAAHILLRGEPRKQRDALCKRVILPTTAAGPPGTRCAGARGRAPAARAIVRWAAVGDSPGTRKRLLLDVRSFLG